ncbi:hypothetical protein BJ322DRAFT_1104479 [Thelephora terrestris]|uniref:Uncharacterized protein n=1 Tax=Thelephora terrestris TaxID=56493 RepID=A0A9P6HMK6_9AGAM|nr:hypothetical protein BJ322DRAFT_1104479 [Thelephora terrestris]
MIAFTCHGFLGENTVSLSIDGASQESQVSASVVFALNVPCVFDRLGCQRSSVVVKVPTLNGFYISKMNLSVSYGPLTDVSLGSDWILLCQPVFINDHPSILNPMLNTIQALPPLHSWQPTSGFYSKSRSTAHNFPAQSA